MHLIFSRRMDEQHSSFCAWIHLTALLFSAAWNCTQLTEQVLTCFVGDKTDQRMRLCAGVLALAWLYLWNDDWIAFWAALAMTLGTVSAWAFGSA